MSESLDREKRVRARALALYKNYPGIAETVEAWGADPASFWEHCTGEDEYLFCKAIAEMIDAVNVHVHIKPD